MPFTFKQFHIDDEQCGMAVSTDAVILGAWAQLTQSSHILDIGAGSGLLSLMAAQRSLEHTNITAVELDSAAASACKHNIKQSPWPNKVQLFHGAIQDFQKQFDKNITPLFDHIICNPPFFEQGTQAKNSARADARHTNTLSFAELQHAISQLLAPHGHASIILPQQSLASFIQQLKGQTLFVAKHLEIISAEGKSPNRSILVLKHATDTAEQTQYLQMAIRNKQGGYSETMIDLCRPFYLKL
ncbi:tRNA1(Val) (adenine(37)-N6)-methyltransferase [Shewanella saliphila]|uniref:tRNA1(Val) (adenine(37)-N6)-methyltransferase n=1 Tax=Shewanella saliphila TaxID=2282698 RepID=A0ABQ2Q3Y7_9GAMM|nr:methyltransferase [Shewanella saliphila]MCL1101082.1 methyltransferase [Shewanella saliphila]GGP45715.1 tRNA1(Val) (adenine(37)-N6)-methyltransferase [Shewanella saliphila]